MQIDERKIHRYLVFAILLTHILGLWVNVIDAQASEYASISREMLKEGHWLQVHHRHEAYLGIPPLMFWFSAISFKIFGFSNFAFKLPSFLFIMLAMYSTFRLTKIHHGRRAGRIASIILGSSQVIFAFSMDVQTSMGLMGAMIFALWQITEYVQNQRYKHLAFATIGIAWAMLAGGIIGFILPLVLFIGDSILLKRQKDIFKWQWLMAFGFLVLLLTPMFYGLYEQFDKHPELVIRGQTGISGVKYYLLGHSENPEFPIWKNSIWGFIPWIFVFVLALINRFKFFRKEVEYIGLGGIILTPIMCFFFYNQHFSFLLMLPFLAILSGAYLTKMKIKPYIQLKKAQLVLLFPLWIAVFILLFYIFTPLNVAFAFLAVGIFGLFAWSFWKLPQKQVLIFATTLTAVGMNVVFNGHSFPNLLKYQSTSEIGQWLKTHPYEQAHFASFQIHSDVIDFYGNKIFPVRESVSDFTQNDRFLYTTKEGLLALKKEKIPYIKMQTYEHFSVAELGLSFFRPNGRSKEVQQRFLVAIYPDN